jgi:hypothetical protein
MPRDDFVSPICNTHGACGEPVSAMLILDDQTQSTGRAIIREDRSGSFEPADNRNLDMFQGQLGTLILTEAPAQNQPTSHRVREIRKCSAGARHVHFLFE